MAPRRRRRAGGRHTVKPLGNLLHDLPDTGAGEVGETVLAVPGLRIERIVSLGQESPPGFWYDQPQAEFVLLLAGAVIYAGSWIADVAHSAASSMPPRQQSPPPDEQPAY